MSGPEFGTKSFVFVRFPLLRGLKEPVSLFEDYIMDYIMSSFQCSTPPFLSRQSPVLIKVHHSAVLEEILDSPPERDQVH